MTKNKHESEVWLECFKHLLPKASSIEAAACFSDTALEEYKKRFNTSKDRILKDATNNFDN